MSRKVINIVSYDPSWPSMFEAARLALHAIFHDGGQIEHVGSTAVPGLGAKPIIDIMIGLTTFDRVTRAFPGLEGLGYEYVSEYEAEFPDRRYFRKPAEHPRTHHLHIVERGSNFWTRHLLFRDRLRGNRQIAKTYETLKRALAIRYRHDGVGYTNAKTEFIEGVLHEADCAR